MPRSNGIFSLIASYFATPGTTIRTEQHNPVLEDIANALTGSLPRDGSAPMLANLPMNNRRITGLAAATASSDAPRLDQVTKYSAFLNSTSALSLAANEFVYASASGTAAKATITPFARGILDDADAATMRVTLGVPSTGVATASANGLMSAADKTKLDNGRFPTAPGAAPVYACRAFGTVNSNGTSGGGANFTCARLAEGRYRVTFQTPAPNADYAISATLLMPSRQYARVAARSATYFDVWAQNPLSDSQDDSFFTFAVFY